MPVYNVYPYLESSILSVLNGKFENFELIIVNDASTDGSLKIANMFAEIDERVRVVDLRYNTIGGAGTPSNIGVENAQGKYIGFIDSDDFYSSRGLFEIMQSVQQVDADVYIAKFCIFRDDLRSVDQSYDMDIWNRLPKDKPLAPKNRPALFKLSPVPWRKIYRKEFLEKHSIRFPEVDHFFEDNPLHWDVLSAAKSVVLVDTDISFHRMERAGQTMSSNSPNLSAFFKHLTLIAQVLQKNKAKFAWGEFLHYIYETRWIVARQKDLRLASQFKKRFYQFMQEIVLPNVGEAHSAGVDKILKRFKFESSFPDLSFVIFADNLDERLDATISSIRELKNGTNEIILMSPDERVQAFSKFDEVLTFTSNRNRYKSYNMAIPLCSGKLIGFLQAGDLVNANAVKSVLDNPSVKSIDKFSSNGNDQSEWGEASALYRRRFVQEHALSFGPSELGYFTFQILSSLFEQKAVVEKLSLISRSEVSNKYTQLAPVNWEANSLIHLVRHLGLNNEDKKFVLDSISKLISNAEAAVTLDSIKDLELSRDYLTTQIASSFSSKAGAL